MQLSVIKIGNSRGIRLPKAVLEQCGIADVVEMEINEQKIVLKPANTKPRQGWQEQFSRMSREGDDTMVISDSLELDSGDWEW